MRSVTKIKLTFFMGIVAIMFAFTACDQVSQFINPEKLDTRDDIPALPIDSISSSEDRITVSDLDSISPKTLAEKLIYKDGQKSTTTNKEKK